MGRKEGMDPFFAYDANYLIDNKSGIILDAEGTRANRSDEIAITETMMDRVEAPLRSPAPAARRRHCLWRGQAAEVAGGSSDHAARPGVGQVRTIRRHLQPGRLRLRPRAQRLHLPEGKPLHTTGTVIDGGTLRYRASKRDCDVCASKCGAVPTRPSRQVPRDLHEDARDVARALANTEAFEQSRRERKKVEMRFAHMKRILKLDRLRLRGLSGAKDEVLLTATAQNLRRLVKFLCRPPPSAALTCAA